MALSDQQVDSLARQAIQHAAGGDFAAAEQLFAEVADARPNSGQAQHLLGQARLKLGRFAEARDPLQRAAQFLPRDASAQVNFAGCLSILGEHELALAALERAARLRPQDAAILHNQGRALEALGRKDEAERAYDQALAIDHRLQPSLSARAALLAARGEWAGSLADLDMALTAQPGDAALRLRRGELLLGQGDWLRGLDDYEARLDLPGLYAPPLPRWHGEALRGRLLIYPEQPDIESDAAMRDTLMLARGVEATLECPALLAPWIDLPTVRRGDSLDGFAAAAPLRSLPRLLGWTLQTLPPAAALRLKAGPAEKIGWFTALEPPGGAAVERDPAKVGECRTVTGDDVWPAHLAARLGIETTILLGSSADWLWGRDAGPSPWYAAARVKRAA